MVLGPGGDDPAALAQAIVEGILLTRYRYDPLKTGDTDATVASMTFVAPAERHGPRSGPAPSGAGPSPSPGACPVTSRTPRRCT